MGPCTKKAAETTSLSGGARAIAVLGLALASLVKPQLSPTTETWASLRMVVRSV